MKINPTVNSQWFYYYYYYYLFFFLLLFKVFWAQQPTVSHYSPTNKLMRCKLQVASCRVFMCTNNYLPHIKKVKQLKLIKAHVQSVVAASGFCLAWNWFLFPSWRYRSAYFLMPWINLFVYIIHQIILNG